MLWLVTSLLDGGYCDFGSHFSDDLHTYYMRARNTINGLRCRPLLEPWMRADITWSEQGIAELKATHAVTQALTNKGTKP